MSAWDLALEHASVARRLATRAAERTHLPYDELYQEAMLGLHRAATKLDPSKGTMRSYGFRWAARYIQLYVWEHGAAVHRPWALKERLGNGSKSAHRHRLDSEILTVHLDAPRYDGDGHVGDTFGQDPTPAVEQEIDVRAALGRMTGRRARVMARLLLGETQPEVGKSLQVTRQAVQRLVTDGLAEATGCTISELRALVDAIERGWTTERAIRIELEMEPEKVRRLLAHASSVGAVRRGVDGHFYVRR